MSAYLKPIDRLILPMLVSEKLMNGLLISTNKIDKIIPKIDRVPNYTFELDYMVELCNYLGKFPLHLSVVFLYCLDINIG